MSILAVDMSSGDWRLMFALFSSSDTESFVDSESVSPRPGREPGVSVLTEATTPTYAAMNVGKKVISPETVGSMTIPIPRTGYNEFCILLNSSFLSSSLVKSPRP